MKTTKKLPVRLSDDEVIERGKQLVENIRKTGKAESEREAENKKRKAEIEALELITSKLVDIVEKGEEDRDVECELKKDFERGVVTVVRLDTGEVVETRPMTPDERQEEMFRPRKDRAPAKGKGGNPFGDGGDEQPGEPA